MLSAQDEAFVRLAIERGALAPAAFAQLAGAPVSHQSAVQIVVDQGWLSSLEATAILREVMKLGFGCQTCGWRTGYEGLATRASFGCPCGGDLAPLPARAVDSGSFPLPAGGDISRGPADSDFVRAAFGSTGGRAPVQLGPGHVLGGYQIQRELGRGANGVVFLATRPGIEREFALKVLLDDTTPDAETVARFELEAAIGSKLRDPGVISVYDVGRAQDLLYYAMEYSPGPDLKEVLRERGRLPWREGVELCRQLAETLAYCHDRSVIHRDLKPGNIILDSELNRPRVTDFGLARDRTLAQTMTATGDWLGTPYYMSPEQFLGETDLDHRADIYALGTILFEVLTGERPYVAKSAQELMDLVLDGRPPAPRSVLPELPASLDHVVARAMASDPDERYPDARELAEDLGAILGGKRLGPQRARAAALGFLAAALLFATLAFAYHLRQEQTSASASPSPAPSASPSASQAASPQPSLAAASGHDWGPLLSDWKTWTGELELAPLRAIRPALPEERLRALEATQELARVARGGRGAPWRDLSSILKRARDASSEWPAFGLRLDLLEARLLLARGRSRMALALLAKRTSPQALWLRALAHEASGDPTQAEDLLTRLAEREGPESALAQARAALARGEQERATQLLDRALEVPEAQLELAATLLALGDSKRAGKALATYLARSGPSPRALRLEGDLALARGEVGEALRAYELGAKLLEQDADPELTAQRARALLRAERSADAVQLLASEIPLARLDEELSAPVRRFLVLRGLAEFRLGAEDRARSDWARAAAADAALAREALPASASEEERAAFAAALAPPNQSAGAEGGAVVAVDPQEVMDFWRGLTASANSGGPWHTLQPLGKLPKEALERFPLPKGGSQTERDLATAARAAAEGKSWKDVRFYLTRALETGQRAGEVRAAWMRLARARGQDVEAVAKRLADDPARYGLGAAEASLARAESLWLQGRPGQALAAYRALSAGAEEAQASAVALQAGAEAALLLGDFARARALAGRLGEERREGRGFALAGLAALALNEREEAAKSQRIAYALLGASDYRVLALRGALLAGSGPVVSLFGSGTAGAEARAHLSLGGRASELLALRVLAESDHEKLRAFFAAYLAKLEAVEAPELSQFLGYSWVRLAKERPRCLKAWRRARELDPDLPLPQHYLEAYGEAYQTQDGLEGLR